METKDVQQVTWQNIFENKERNVCTYSQYLGVTVNPGFKNKVQFIEAGLQNNSIVIRNVTEEDEGCYLCLFNTHPDGALTGTTCLKVYELHEPILDVRRSSSPAEFIISCSASGRPAPTVTLTLPQQKLSFSQYNTTSVTNTNGTVTVTTTALLSASSSTQVGCSVSVLSAAPRELLVIVSGLTETSGDGVDKQSKRNRSPLNAAIFIMAVCILFLLFRFHKNRTKLHHRTPQKIRGPDSSTVAKKELRPQTPERLRQNNWVPLINMTT